MKKIILLICMVLFNFVESHSQNELTISCATDELHSKTLESSTTYKANFDSTRELWSQYATKYNGDITSNNRTTPTITTLSLVFHDLSAGSTFIPSATTSIDDYQYIINSLNTVYSGTSLNGVAGNDTFVRFCLARQDVNGDDYALNDVQVSNVPEADGVSSGNLPAILALSNATQTASTFPTSKFINVYIVDNIAGSAGFATLPSSHGNAIDGIYMDRSFLINDANLNDNIVVMTHEIGHYLGLFHTFGICDPGSSVEQNCSCDNDNCLFNGDMICDTPPNIAVQSGYSCAAPPNTCSDLPVPTISDGSHPIIEMNDQKENYMDYGFASCKFLFTPGQITRMCFMLDPDFGPRKGVLNTAICVDCVAMDGCNFSIDHNIADNISVVNTTETFTASVSDCEAASNPNVNYTWQLTNLTTGTGGGSFTGPTVNITPNVLGNYELTLLATLASDGQCFEEVQYYFQVVPDASGSACLQFPTDDSNWNGWEQVSYQGGWALDPAFTGVWDPATATTSDYAHPATVRYTDAATVDPNFEVVNDLSSDPNFSTYTLPANVPNFIRVGAPIDGSSTLVDGAGNYVSMTFSPTAENSRYRIHFVGATANLSNFNREPNVFFNNLNYPSTFGWFSRYEYDSPLDADATIRDIGSYENNASDFNNRFPFNDFVMGNTSQRYEKRRVVSTIPQQNIAGVQYRVMADWDSIELDFSEFVNDPNSTIDDNLNTDITITFFARTNNAAGANAHSYAYFGIECLGGGLPDHAEFDLEDLVISCQSETDESCVRTDNVLARYINRLPYSHYTASIEESLDGVTFGPTSDASFNNSFNGAIGVTGFYYWVCLDDNDPPSKYYRVTLNTMHQTVQDTFQVFKGYFYNDPVCAEDSTNSFIGGDIIGDKNLFTCDGDIPITLNLTDPCFVDTSYNYIWRLNGTVIPGENDAALDINPSQLWIYGCRNSVRREVTYTDPYCGTTSTFSSETFSIFNLNGYRVNISDNEPLEDSCFGEAVNLVVDGALGINGTCDVDEFNDFISDNGLDILPGSITYTLEIDGNPIETITVNYPSGIFTTPGAVAFSPIDNLSVGDHIISYSATSNFNGCANSDVLIGGSYDTNINIAPISVGGEISITDNCDPVNILSINDGASNNDVYEWEYAYTPDFSGTISSITGETGTTISNLNTSVFTSFPVYIRRVSNPFPNSEECEDNTVKYSNIVTLENCITCPNCTEVFTIIAESITPTGRCGEFRIDVPAEFLECYRIDIDYGTGNGIEPAVAGSTIFSYTSNGSYSPAIYVSDLETGEICHRDGVKLNVDCFEECPDCRETLDEVFVQQSRVCGTYQVFVPTGLEDCYQFILYTNGTEIILPEGMSTFSYTENGSYDVDIVIVDIATGDKCDSRSMKLNVDCFEDCPECERGDAAPIHEAMWNSFTDNERVCGEYSFRVPRLADCFAVQIDWGDGNSEIVTGGTIIHNYTANGSYNITLQVLIDGERCGRQSVRKVNVECFECPDCNPRTSAVIQNSLWVTFTEDERECGLYSFEIPQLENCYEILIDWGDGESDTVSNADSGSVLTHQYTTNNTYDLCAQVFVDGEECGIKQCKDVNIACFNECADCSDNVAVLNLLDEISTTVTEGADCGEYTITLSEDIASCFDVKITLGIDDGTGYIDLVEGVNTFTYTYNGDFSLGIYLFDAETGAFCNKLGVPIDVNCFNNTICQDDPALENLIGYHLKTIINGLLSNGFTGTSSYEIPDIMVDITTMPEVVDFMQAYDLQNRIQHAMDVRETTYDDSNYNTYYVADITSVYYMWSYIGPNHAPRLKIFFGNEGISNLDAPKFAFSFAYGNGSDGFDSDPVGLNPTLIQSMTDIDIISTDTGLMYANYEYLGVDGNTHSLYGFLLSTTKANENQPPAALRWCWLHDLDYNPQLSGFQTEKPTKQIKLFPNPADKDITITSNIAFESDYNLIVRNMIGSIVYQGKNESNVNVSNLPDGVYFIELRTITGELYRKQFIVKR